MLDVNLHILISFFSLIEHSGIFKIVMLACCMLPQIYCSHNLGSLISQYDWSIEFCGTLLIVPDGVHWLCKMTPSFFNTPILIDYQRERKIILGPWFSLGCFVSDFTQVSSLGTESSSFVKDHNILFMAIIVDAFYLF